MSPDPPGEARRLWVLEENARGEGFGNIAGLDEAGRGPLAGPVVSAAVILPFDFEAFAAVKDSKKLTPKMRDVLYDLIMEKSISAGVGLVDPLEIDRINILQASLLSMKKAVDALDVQPDFLLIDGIHQIESDIPQRAVVKGDSLSASIAAASILAKVTRDRIMKDMHLKFPEYGFDRHKGYPTKAHREAVRRFGPSPIHRLTFRGSGR